MSDYLKLPLRLLGLRNMPAVPVDIKGMADTLIKLGIRSKESAQASEGLTKTFTIDGETARAHAFLFGGEAMGHHAHIARERLGKTLSGNPLKVLEALASSLRDEGEELLEELRSGKDADSVDLTTLSLDDPKQWSMSWTTLPDVAGPAQGDLDRWAKTVDVETPEDATREFWPTIAEYGLAYNLILPKKIATDDLDSWRSLFPGHWSPAFDQAAAAGSLYVIDLRIYEQIEHQEVDGFTRFTPATVTLMVQDATTKDMTPELVRVSGYEGAGAKIFSRPGGPAAADGAPVTTDAAWVYSLLAAKTSITVYGIWFGHVYHWHIVTAAMQMTMFDNISDDNPVRQLLEPQSDYLIPFDDVLLVLWRFAAPPTSIKTGFQFLELTNIFAKDREFFDDDPTTTLEQLGIDYRDFSTDDDPANRWNKYPIVGRLLTIWKAVEEYVGTYVDHHYSTDEDVQNDKELQAWIKASGNKRDGNVRGLPEMDSKQSLKRVLHSLVYRVTAHGTGRLFRSANPALTFVANFPPCLQDATIPEPSLPFKTKALLRYLPKTGAIGGMVTFYFTFSFSVPYEPFIPIKGLKTDLYLDDKVSNEALIRLRQAVVGFIEHYQPESPQIYQWPLNIET